MKEDLEVLSGPPMALKSEITDNTERRISCILHKTGFLTS